MAKLNLVVALSADDVTDDHREIANKHRPAKRLTIDQLEIYDRIAPILAANDRLSGVCLDYVVEYCRITDDLDKNAILLGEEGKTYEVSGRNGNQIKNRPEVGDCHELRRQQRAYGAELMLSPQAEIQLSRIAMLQHDLMSLYGEEPNDENPFTRDQLEADAHSETTATTRH